MRGVAHAFTPIVASSHAAQSRVTCRFGDSTAETSALCTLCARTPTPTPTPSDPKHGGLVLTAARILQTCAHYANESGHTQSPCRSSEKTPTVGRQRSGETKNLFLAMFWHAPCSQAPMAVSLESCGNPKCLSIFKNKLNPSVSRWALGSGVAGAVIPLLVCALH